MDFRIFRFGVFNILFLIFCDARDVPASTDLCRRFPTSPICSRTGHDVGQLSPEAPAKPPSPKSGSTDKETYCSQYLVHYQYFCVGDGRGDPKAAEFCSSYKIDCGETPHQPSGQQVGPATQDQQSSPCSDYRNEFNTLCAQRSPTTSQAYRFCEAYAEACFEAANAQSVPVQQVPVQQVPVQQIPVQQVPVQQVPVQQVPVQQVPVQQVPVQQVPVQQAVPQQPGGAPLTVGSGTSVGNFANVGSQTAVSPFSGVSTGRTVGAGPVGVSSGSAVNFGGIPGLSALNNSPFGSMLGRRKKRQTLSEEYIFRKMVNFRLAKFLER